MKWAMLTMTTVLLGGCSMHPDGLNWLPPAAHGSQPDLPCPLRAAEAPIGC